MKTERIHKLHLATALARVSKTFGQTMQRRFAFVVPDRQGGAVLYTYPVTRTEPPIGHLAGQHLRTRRAAHRAA